MQGLTFDQEVISKEFSQKQRVLLQRWIANDDAQNETQADAQQEQSSCTQIATGVSNTVVPFKQGGTHAEKQKCKPKAKTAKRTVSGTRGVSSKKGSYNASVFIDWISIQSRYCDLATAVEYLVILTSAKQKLQEQQRPEAFEEQLGKALRSSAAEHGRTAEELKVRFHAVVMAGMFIGRYQIESPVVHSLEDLGKIRQCMEPCRAVRKMKGNCFKNISLVEFQALWQQFQQGVADMFHVTGRDSEIPLGRIRAWYHAHEGVRSKNLQQWERHYMSRQDHEKHRPQHIRYVRKKYSNWKNHDFSADCLTTLKKLLVRWEGLLKREAFDREKHRRRVLQQRKKESEVRRQELRKRMRDPHLTMADILGRAERRVFQPVAP